MSVNLSWDNFWCDCVIKGVAVSFKVRLPVRPSVKHGSSGFCYLMSVIQAPSLQMGTVCVWGKNFILVFYILIDLFLLHSCVQYHKYKYTNTTLCLNDIQNVVRQADGAFQKEKTRQGFVIRHHYSPSSLQCLSYHQLFKDYLSSWM